MPEITIATSIAPRNLELQRAAIDSWLNLGFKVISLNSMDEASTVVEKFPDIPIKIVNRTAMSVAGKPYIYFDDVRAALLDEQSEIYGIVNSDIFLVADSGFTDFVSRKAKNGLLFGSRIDIDSMDNLDGEKFIYGFDFFFFERSLVELYPSSDFCLGAPWWDYWAPLVPILQAKCCYELVSPVAFHVRHEAKWANNLFFDFGKMFADKVAQIGQSLSALNARTTAGLPENMTIFSFDVLVHILKCSVKVCYPESVGSRSLVSVGQSQYLAMRERVIDHLKCCVELREQMHEQAIATELQEQMDRVYSSLSWRITKPLRWLGDRVRRMVG